MADDKRMIAVAIAVADSVPRKYLAGAIRGAQSVADWALSQQYETVLVTDEKEKVTIPLLRQRIEELLCASPTPIHRIIIYFAGHGLIRELEEGLWLLSDWRKELRAVAVEVLKRRLSMYGPRQICIISDACRSLPADVEQADLVPDAVLGAGPQPVDLSFAIDKFIATQDGTESFMIPGEDPQEDRCLFSGVLAEGLWGLPGLHGEPFSKLVPGKITSQSLGDYLRAEVPARAKDYDLTVKPIILPTFPNGDDYYFSKDPPMVAPKFPPWPPKGKLTGMAPSDGPVIGRMTGWIGAGAEVHVNVDPVRPLSNGETSGGSINILDQLRQQPVPGPADGVWTGVAVSGGSASRFWTVEERVVTRLASPGTWSIADVGSYTISTPAPVLIEFSDGLFAATVALHDLFTSVVRDQYGVTGVIYRNLQAPPEIAAPAEEALAALETGALRADAATDLAVQLRKWKHADPVLGVISAYLYDAIGDVESIRRMASFYAQYGEAIPYDIALLGGLRGHRTDCGFEVEVPEVKERKPRTTAEQQNLWTYCHMGATQGLVGGLWPWMRQGWTFLDDPTDVGSPLILQGLVELRSGLMRSRFATLEKDAALALANLCGLRVHSVG